MQSAGKSAGKCAAKRPLRRAAALLLTVVLLAGLCVTGAGAATVVDSGDCGYVMGMNNIVWTLDTDGVLTISGSGAMEYWVNANYQDWAAYQEQILTATLSDGITDLAPYCFYNCVNLTAVSIPDSVTTVYTAAFRNAASLTEIVLPAGVTSIGTYAFAGCTGLTAFTIPDGITTIDGSTFAGCTGLTTVSIPDSVTTIKSSAFSGCTALAEAVLTEQITSIGGSAFSGCTGITALEIPDSVTSIGNSAFSGCTGLTSVSVGSSVTSLGSNAFAGCTQLREITFTGAAPDIGADAFSGVTATVYYPAGDSSWTAVTAESYGGNITWTAVGEGAQYPDDTGTGSWSWAADYIYACREADLISAYADGSFGADDNITRAVLVESLYRLAGSPAVTGSSSFSDVADSDEHAAAILWASQNGIVTGYDDGTFAPDASVTRAQMAAIFQRYAAWAGCDTGEAADLGGYTDAGSIHSYALEAMQWANAAGLINGRSETTLVPGGTTTRAEAAKILISFRTWMESA